MAKMIKCPTCGTSIEVPPQASGQIVKCPGCGKGLKLVAKAKPPAGGAGIQLSASGSPINPNSSVAGGSISAMSFHGEPSAPPDDLPSLDTCAVCGRPTAFEDLSEDNGKLVCGDCIKGARSGMARSGNVDLLAFKAPDYQPTRRGKMINITPAFLGAVVMALIWVGCQFFLSMYPKPVGKGGVATAHSTKPGQPVPEVVKPGTPDAAPTTSQSAEAPATQPGDVAVAPAGKDPKDPEIPPTPAPPGATTIASGPPAEPSSIFSPDGAGTQAPPAPAPVTPQPIPPAPAPAVAASDPLDRGMERLMARDYDAALRELDAASKLYPIRVQPGVALSPQVQLRLEALAAAHLGNYLKHRTTPKLADNVRSTIELGYRANVRTRSLLLNAAISAITSTTNPNAVVTVSDLVKAHLESHPGDEYAADVYGSLINKLANNPPKEFPKDKLDAYWAAFDTYTDQMSAQNEGKLKWGVDWLPADEVKSYRPLRGAARESGGVTTAAKKMDAAALEVRSAESALLGAQQRKAAGQPADVAGAETILAAAKAKFDKAAKDLEDANAKLKYRKPRWLESFEPVVPQAAP